MNNKEQQRRECKYVGYVDSSYAKRIEDEAYRHPKFEVHSRPGKDLQTLNCRHIYQ